MILFIRRYVSRLPYVQNAQEASIVCGHMSPEHRPKGTCLCFARVGHVTLLELLERREEEDARTKGNPQM